MLLIVVILYVIGVVLSYGRMVARHYNLFPELEIWWKDGTITGLCCFILASSWVGFFVMWAEYKQEPKTSPFLKWWY